MTSKHATSVIAEAGVNHNGSLDLAVALIDAAAGSGADFVKFQTFRAEALVTHSAPKAEYQVRSTGGAESQFEMLKRLELRPEHHRMLIDAADKAGIGFLSTPFDVLSLRTLTRDHGLTTIKIGSGDLTNAPLLIEAAREAKSVIISTGMASLGDVERALSALAFGFLASAGEIPSAQALEEAYASADARRVLRERVCVLHCTTEYPAPVQDVNLRSMVAMREAFGTPVGYSDHTEGIIIPVAAVALGATVIEKHFTTDRNLPGPDHQASLLPNELTEMVRAIRQVEASLGDGIKRCTPSERGNAAIARKSIVAAMPIEHDEVFSLEKLTLKRPGTGRTPFDIWSLVGQRATRRYEVDDLID